MTYVLYFLKNCTIGLFILQWAAFLNTNVIFSFSGLVMGCTQEQPFWALKEESINVLHLGKTWMEGGGGEVQRDVHL